MNTIFLTVPATEKVDTSVNLEGLKEKAQGFLGDERVRKILSGTLNDPSNIRLIGEA